MRSSDWSSDVCSSDLVDVNISISTAFGCPMEGDVPAEEVLRLGDFFAERGAQGITICDTTGMANPAQVEALCQGLIQRWSNLELTLHFHNTRGMGLRSEESRVGKACVSTGRSRGSAYH